MRVRIDNPVDRENNAPVFNGSAWPQTLTIFCDAVSTSQERCGTGAALDLTAFFSDADHDASLLIFDIYNDPATFEDDDYGAYIRITADGTAIYNPMDFMAQTTTEISEWSLDSVMFEARDEYDSVAYSFRVNYLVRPVVFDVEKVSTGAVLDVDAPVTFRGTGLPGETVEARFMTGGLINQTRVASDGTWEMDITASNFNSDSIRDIRFEMASQAAASGGVYTITPAAAADSGGNTLLLVLGALVAIVGLAAVVLIFFVEFEEDLASDEVDGTEAVEEDPYAWAKKSTPEIPAQQAAAAPAAAPAPAASQHPGWLWDAEANQWVPDPNYTPPGQ
jgi:hypothetical protein